MLKSSDVVMHIQQGCHVYCIASILGLPPQQRYIINVRTRVSTGIPGSRFQPGKTRKNHDFSGLENNAEKPGNNPEISGTRNSEFPGSNPEPGKISGFQPGTRKNFRVPTRKIFRVPTRNSEIFPGSILEPETQKFFQIPTRNARSALFIYFRSLERQFYRLSVKTVILKIFKISVLTVLYTVFSLFYTIIYPRVKCVEQHTYIISTGPPAQLA